MASAGEQSFGKRARAWIRQHAWWIVPAVGVLYVLVWWLVPLQLYRCPGLLPCRARRYHAHVR
jgi:hypothetical protein